MIIMIILIFLSITLLSLYFSLFRDNEYFLAMVSAFALFTIAVGSVCVSIHTCKITIENTKFELDCEYEFLSEHKDSVIYLERIADYNSKIIQNKKALHSVWTNWFVSPVYENAKLIGEEK